MPIEGEKKKMAFYDEGQIEEAIRALPKDMKAHLSHIVRNGIIKVSAAYRRGGDVDMELGEFEESIRRLGL